MPYIVETCPDDVERLKTLLHSLGEEGSRVINVIWQPTRDLCEGSSMRLDLARCRRVDQHGFEAACRCGQVLRRAA